MNTFIGIAITLVVLFSFIRGLYITYVTAWSFARAGRFHRDPPLPSFILMFLKIWIWHPLKITNDIEYLEHFKNKTGPYDYLHPDYPEKRRKILELQAKRYAAIKEKNANNPNPRAGCAVVITDHDLELLKKGTK
jgi:hypothetical protein